MPSASSLFRQGKLSDTEILSNVQALVETCEKMMWKKPSKRTLENAVESSSAKMAAVNRKPLNHIGQGCTKPERY
jgi:hypothetical protein